MKRLFAIAAVLALSACATAPVDPNATPDQVAAAKKAQAQANFDTACKWADGAVSTAQPLVPLLATKLGDNGTLAVDALFTTIKTTCSSPLDINSADAITQRVYDAAGQVIALVVKAQQA